jgi:hypothetical protein
MNVAMQVGATINRYSNLRQKTRIGAYGQSRPFGLNTNSRQLEDNQYNEEMAKKVQFTNLAVDSPTRSRASNSPFDPNIPIGNPPRSQLKFTPLKILGQNLSSNILTMQRMNNDLP